MPNRPSKPSIPSNNGRASSAARAPASNAAHAPPEKQPSLTALSLYAGIGGQALGIQRAGFRHIALVDKDFLACQTLERNFPQTNVMMADVRDLDVSRCFGVDLLAAELPASGPEGFRNQYPVLLGLIAQIEPAAVMIESCCSLSDDEYAGFRRLLVQTLRPLRYDLMMLPINAADHGVPQERHRSMFVALRGLVTIAFRSPIQKPRVTAGTALRDMMAARGWRGANRWAQRARGVSPTLVDRSHVVNGCDLGSRKARENWAALGIDGHGIAAEAPARDFSGMPRLTVPMLQRLQGLPDDWAQHDTDYKRVINSSPPAVAEAVAQGIKAAILEWRQRAGPDDGVDPNGFVVSLKRRRD